MTLEEFSALSECASLLRHGGSHHRALALVRSANRGGGWWMPGRRQNDDAEFFITGAIKPDTAFLSALQTVKGKITLRLDCPGGCGRTSSQSARWLEHRGNTLAVVQGDCRSAGVDLLLACDRRVADAGAKFMIHGSKAWVFGGPGELRRAADDLDRDVDAVAEFVSRRTGQPREVVSGWLSGTDREFTAAEALRVGLVHLVQEQPASLPAPSPTAISGDDQLAIELAYALRRLPITESAAVARILKPLVTS